MPTRDRMAFCMSMQLLTHLHLGKYSSQYLSNTNTGIIQYYAVLLEEKNEIVAVKTRIVKDYKE